MQEGTMNGERQTEESAVGRAMSALENQLGPQLEQIRETFTTLNQKTLRVMRTYPGTSLLVAVGIGFAIGRLASRR